MRASLQVGRRVLPLALGAFALAACSSPKRKPFSYYEERIAPILDVGCQRQTTGCHVDDGHGFALGNLDLTSYKGLTHRRDTLDAYGPYSVPLLLLKGGDPIQVQVRTVDPPDPSMPDRRYVTVTTDIRHGGGEGAIAQGSQDYALLKQWIDGGYTATGVPAKVELTKSIGACASGTGLLPGIDVEREPADAASFTRFVSEVQPILLDHCAGSSCHGSRQADMYLSCGHDAREQRWNYAIVTRYLNEQAVTSELLRRPLAQRAGGVFHEGGDVFADTEDRDYRTILKWAEDIAKRVPEQLRWQPQDGEPGLRFFANRVQPMLVRKGCMFLACHSPAMFHDLRLRGGSRGEFSEVATRKNYEMSRLMLALESPDPNDSRLFAKNLCPPASGGRGVKHRGGALFEDFGGCGDETTRASLAQCVGVDADAGDLNEVPAYCVLARWHAIEREQAIGSGALDPDPGPRGVVFVARPEGIGGPTEFDTFQGGADLMWSDASLDTEGHLQLGAPRSLLGSCGLPADADVRGPAVSWDGKRIAFAARADAGSPLRIYEMQSDGSACAQIPGLAADADMQDGILLHDFDPAYAPDDRIVFASTRGFLDGSSGLRGPTRTPAALQPNANIYVFDANASPPVRQLTYLLDQELAPSVMRDGRIVFSTEKRARDFHQIAGRRQNLDGGDYHPLFAQRPSVGFESATEIVELANRDFAIVAAPLDARDGGGAIAVVNRSIGPDQDDRDAGDRAYIHSLSMPVPGAFGGTMGVFRSPAPLPSGYLIAACDLGASDLRSTTPHYGLCELDPSSDAAPRMLYSDATRVAIEPAAVYARLPLGVFTSRSEEVNGSTAIEAGEKDAIVHYLDVPLLGTLMFANTRTGRPIDERVSGVQLLTANPPPNDATGFGGLDHVVTDDYGPFYENLKTLGHASLEADGSLRARVPGGAPLLLALTNQGGSVLDFEKGAPFSGAMRQREAMQFYPGEHAKQALSRHMFDGLCAGCHGSVSGRELDVGISVDILTSASRSLASDELRDLR
jgi:hypothetical protein